ncbi:hypothetical protein [Rhodopila sp.]|uniref:hypothetical protein n=1 Tax=Rhodopila sp. TaxID=2480087 RepID=UPI003D0E89C8
MKVRILVSLLALTGLGFGWNSPANAIGCISGGAAGAVAGHLAHHGILGAVGGCIAGHELHKHQQRAAAAQAQGQYNQAPNQYNQAPNQYNQAPNQYNQAPNQYNRNAQ